jgi:hypothetical protein
MSLTPPQQLLKLPQRSDLLMQPQPMRLIPQLLCYLLLLMQPPLQLL